jgi:hypothetical protein
LAPVGEHPEHQSSCWLPHNEAERAEVRRRVLAQELAS